MTGDTPPGRRPHGDVWVVSGPPGAGKSTVTAALVSALAQVPAVLDKDTLFNGLTEEVLRAYGRHPGEREGVWYDDHIKVHEYAAITAATQQIRGHGCPVLLEAPFTMQIRDPQTWSRFVDQLGGERVELIWIRSDRETLRRRLIHRGNPRDVGKLERFEEFIARIQPERAPSVRHLEIDNRDGAASIQTQLAALMTVDGMPLNTPDRGALSTFARE